MNSKCVGVRAIMDGLCVDSLGSPLQISLRLDANCRVMYGLDGAAASLVVKQD